MVSSKSKDSYGTSSWIQFFNEMLSPVLDGCIGIIISFTIPLGFAFHALSHYRMDFLLDFGTIYQIEGNILNG
jgi:hypothetical protein